MIKYNNYPDGSGYPILTEEQIIYKRGEFTFKVNSYTDLWKLTQINSVAKNLGYILTITIPNLIDAQADRRFKENMPNSLVLVCEFLKSLDNLRYRIFHPHNSEVVEAILKDRVKIFSNAIFIEEVLEEIGKDVLLLSSDAGGFKPLMKLCEEINWEGETSSASKSRGADGSILQVLPTQDFKGKDILIVDDISVYGGTFKGLSKLLKESNPGKVYLAVSHMTVQQLKEDPVTDYFEKVFTTNSKFDEYFFIDEEVHKIPKEDLKIIKMFNYE